MVLKRSNYGKHAVADEIADDIWTLVDSIRAEAGVPMTRQDEMRVLAIRRKLTHRLTSATGYRDRGESAPPKKLANPKDSLADRQDGILLRHSHRAASNGQHT